MLKKSINYCKDKAYAQKVMAMALYLGQLLVKYGAEIYRTEDTISRICESYENLTAIDVFGLSNGLFISLEYNNEVITMYKNASVGNLNLEKINLLNTFSRKFVKDPQDVQAAIQDLRAIEDKDEYSFPLKFLASGLAASFFALLFGADTMDAVCTFFVGSLSYGGVFLLSKYDLTFFIESFLGAFFSSFFAMICILLGAGHNIDHIIIGSIMLFVPGVVMTNAVRDIMSDDFLSGLIGLVKAIFIALAIAIGVGIVLSFHLK
ncbi:threonine/serine ThrE exporter family protein [Urinicoccus massiliensis]|uniref:threonine/serine ThrE exporter family protein n=1 Tax=Urinicoccus massiliensis TaxID=1723382 RepID=UPI00068C64D1|nr:threonine/serine exporter family protein [Urinicoccus massiliensis]